MIGNRPVEDWGKLLGDVPTATAILNRFLHHAEIFQFADDSHPLSERQRAKCAPNEAKAPTGSARAKKTSKRANAPTGGPV